MATKLRRVAGDESQTLLDSPAAFLANTPKVTRPKNRPKPFQILL